jgi:acyl-CoA thioesterase-1
MMMSGGSDHVGSGERRQALRYAAGVVMLAIAGAACDSGSGPTSPTAGGPSGPAVVRTVVVLGDSLAVSPSPRQGFPARLQGRLDRAGLRYTVKNAGVSGDTTAGGLSRLPSLLTADVAVMIVALGSNDGLRGVGVERIEENLSTIIETAQRTGIRVLLCGMEVPPVYGWPYTVAFHGIFPRLASRYSVPLVPFLLAGVALVPELNGADRVHPNDAGAERIADTVWPFLETLLQSSANVAQ